jgi:hypothetical protein
LIWARRRLFFFAKKNTFPAPIIMFVPKARPAAAAPELVVPADATTVPPAAADRPRDTHPKVWLSVSDALIANRCWVCDAPFQRGLRKKVFQISQLVNYLTQRRDRLVGAGEEAAAAAPVTVDAPPTTTVTSHNLVSWYAAFVEDLGGSEAKLEEALKACNVTPWFSGLVCCTSEACLRQYQLVVPPTADEAAAAAQALQSLAGKLAADCPPGCGCDNPWPFLAASVPK